MGSWGKIGKLGIGCEARQRVESWGEAQRMIPASFTHDIWSTYYDSGPKSVRWVLRRNLGKAHEANRTIGDHEETMSDHRETIGHICHQQVAW